MIVTEAFISFAVGLVVVCEVALHEVPSLFLLKVGGAVLQHCGLYRRAIGCPIFVSTDSLDRSLEVYHGAVLYFATLVPCSTCSSSY